MGLIVGSAALLLVLIGASTKPAVASSYVYRPLTLPRSTWELGLGVGLARVPENLGLGFNLELGVGIASALELRFRTGLRVGDDGRNLGADIYGRPYDTETYNTGGDTFANPEIGVKAAFVQNPTLSLGLDLRLTLPVGSELGLLGGLPLVLHLGRARIETGIYLLNVFNDDNDYTLISIPFHLFIAVDAGTYLGPITGVRFHEPGGETVPLGLAVGTSIAYDADLRLWLLFPDVSRGGSARVFGVGMGLYVVF